MKTFDVLFFLLILLNKLFFSSCSNLQTYPIINSSLVEIKNLDSNLVKQINDVSEKIKSLSQKVDTSFDHYDETLESIEEIKEKIRKVRKEHELQGLRFEWKINIINNKLMKQIEIMLIMHEIQLQREIVECEDRIRSLKIQIKKLKTSLPSSSSICYNLKNCRGCTANPGCGWCSSTQSCIEGDEKGPFNGSCSFYDFKQCIGPKPCNTYLKCEV